MKKIFLFFLVTIVISTNLHRIDDKEIATFTPNDYIVSPAGLYRIKLRANNCSIIIEQFNSSIKDYKPYK